LGEAERVITASMPDPDAPRPGNPIHSTGGARERGFRAALVGGATVYGWAVPAIVGALGSRWLCDGWADVAFRRPVYPGDLLHVIVRDGALTIGKREGGEHVVAVRGQVGLGAAPWLGDLAVPGPLRAEPRAASRPRLARANVPLGRPLPAREVHLGVDEALAFARDRQQETLPELLDATAPLAHPAWIVAQPIHLLHHAFDYGPAIHVASRVQHRAPARAGGTFVVGGRCVDAYARNGSEYIVNDAAIAAPDGVTVALLRHTAIYEVAARAGTRDAARRDGGGS
jgi:acyl dehydratase